MKEEATGFWNEVLLAVADYWQAFLHVLPRLAFALVVGLLLVVLARQVSRLATARLSQKAKDPLFARFVANLIHYALLSGCLILFLHILGLTGIAGGLLAGAGLSALIFGFAFKDIAENFLAGIILAFDRPFGLHDTVRIGEEVGHVVALNFRTTHVKTFDEKDVFIPNARIIKEPLVNLTRDGLIRLDFVVGIAYEDDIAAAVALLVRETAKVEGVDAGRQPFAVVEDLATSTVNLRVFFWSQTDDYKKGVLITKGEVMRRVKESLVTQGFTLPANIQELKLYDKRRAFPVELLPSANGQ